MDECLICRTVLFSTTTTEKDEGHLHKDNGGRLDLLQNEIETFYFLHKLLKVPLDLITSLLVRSGSGDFLSSSCTLCAPCRLSYLMEGRRIFNEIQRLEAAHEELSRVIVANMRVKVEVEEEEDLDLCLLPEAAFSSSYISSKGRGDEIREYLLMHYGCECGDQAGVDTTTTTGPIRIEEEQLPPGTRKSDRGQKENRDKKQRLLGHFDEELELSYVKEEPMNKVPCDLCGKLLHRNSLSRHIVASHSSQQNSQGQDQRVRRRRPKKKVKVGKRLPCQVCKRSFLTQTGLDGHLGRSHRVRVRPKRKNTDSESHLLRMYKSCPICKPGSKSANFSCEVVFQAHSHPDPNDPSIVTYNCPECPRVFSTRKYFKHHYLTHGGKVVCEICGVVCRNPPQLGYHMDTKHSTKDLHSCSQCDLRFPTPFERVNHERVVHKGLSSTECYFCHRFCQGLSSLEKHLRIHTLERPFTCVKCGKEFGAANGLNRHVDAVCGDDEEARRKVREEWRRNEIKRRLNNAMKKHICHICGIQFGQKPQLKNHLERYHSI